MSWRKWFVRGLVFSIVAGVAGAWFLYYRWTSSANVKQGVLAYLGAHFPGAQVSLDSARLRLLGEVSLNELHLSQRDGKDQSEFAYVPSALIFHDKEQLNDGKVAVRKVELDKPRFRFVRLADGSWNVAHVLGPQSDQPQPIFIIKDGTVIFEDRVAGTKTPAVEIKNVNLVVTHDAQGPITFEGKGHCPLAGLIKIKGSWSPSPCGFAVSLQADAVPLTPSFMNQLSRYWPEAGEHAEQLEGIASLKADFTYRPQGSLQGSGRRNQESGVMASSSLTPNPRPLTPEVGQGPAWSHNLHWQLRQGKFRHPQLPIPLEEIEAAGQCMEGRVTLERLTARAGSARLKMDGTAKGLRADSDFVANVTVTNLNLKPEMFERLPPIAKKIQIEYSPTGLLDLTCRLERNGGKWFRHADVRLKDVAGEFWKFRYPVEHVSGQIIQDIDPRHNPPIDTINLNLVGWGGGQKVYIKGEVNGDGPEAGVAVRIWGDNFPLDKKLQAALQIPQQKLAEAFHPAGFANFDADIRRAPLSRKFNNHYVVHFHHASARYDVFPYPLENIEGDLDIRGDDSWEFRNFSATHKGCQVTTWGESQPTAQGSRLLVNIQGRDLTLDPELEAALQPELKEAWQSFHPAGKMNFSARVTNLGQLVPDVVVHVTPIDCSVRPNFFPYLLTQLNGSLRYENRHVHLEKLRAVHDSSVMTLEDIDVYMKPEGGVYARLNRLQGSPLIVNDDLRKAMPPVLRNICESVDLHDPVKLNIADLRIATFANNSQPTMVYWDGDLDVTDATLHAGVAMEHVTGKIACRGSCQGDELKTEPGHSPLVGNLLIQDVTILKQPFHNLHASMEVPENRTNTLLLRGIHATIFGGEVYGESKVELGPNPAYELNLTGSQIRLEDFARHNLKPGVKMTGPAGARLYLTGRGKDLRTLSGNGSLDVPKGRMYELNILVDLLKILNLRVPDGTAFEEAHAAFSIRGDQVTIQRMDLLGSPVSLGGKGKMKIDGSDLDLEFYAVWARVMQALPPIINEIPKEVSKQFLKIKMHGDLGVKVETIREPVPILVEPLKELLQVMSGKKIGRNSESTNAANGTSSSRR
jgi:hypothetical protein